MKYSVLISVYLKDNPKWLKESIDSMLRQTIKPNEIVIVKDGQLTNELEQVLKEYKNIYRNIKIVSLKVNVGLGKALNEGIKYCSNELIARQDSDDLSEPNRLEKQLQIMSKNKDIALVGAQITEFIDKIDNEICCNTFPTQNDDIVKYAHRRNPFSHSAVLFKKNMVLKSGGYQDAYLCEDYDLWIRMILNKCILANSSEVLHHVRINDNFYKRRSGLKYIKSINNLMLKNMKNGFFTKRDYLYNIFVRSVVYLLPNFARTFIYKKFLRKDSEIRC